MTAFPCSSCGKDLIENIEQAVVSLKFLLNLEEEEVPESYSLNGACPACKAPYCFDGSMFSHYIDTKIADTQIDSEEAELMETEAIVLTPSEQSHLDRLIKEERFDEINDFLQGLSKE